MKNEVVHSEILFERLFAYWGVKGGMAQGAPGIQLP